jgi:hypothetical protein
MKRWQDSIESDEAVPCRNVNLREILTIGDVDDYDDWRNRKGEHDPKNWPTESTGRARGLKGF